jgi:hypothetical protein
MPISGEKLMKNYALTAISCHFLKHKFTHNLPQNPPAQRSSVSPASASWPSKPLPSGDALEQDPPPTIKVLAPAGVVAGASKRCVQNMHHLLQHPPAQRGPGSGQPSRRQLAEHCRCSPSNPLPRGSALEQDPPPTTRTSCSSMRSGPLPAARRSPSHRQRAAPAIARGQTAWFFNSFCSQLEGRPSVKR